MDDFEPYFPEEPEEEPEDASQTPIPVVPSETRRLRSRADDVVDAMEGRPLGRRKKLVCVCGAESFRTIRPVGGGVVSKQCKKCRKVIPWGSTPSSFPPAARRTEGPFLGESFDPPDRTAPTYRSRSVSKESD
jgi:hypothetical protein